MWRGGRDAEGWKLRERDLESVASEQSFDTLAGQDDPGSAQNEDEDMAGINHRIDVKRGKVGVHAPADGLTTPVPRFRDDVAALLRLTDFDLPPLRVVRPTQVVQVFYFMASGMRQESNSEPPSPKIIIVKDICRGQRMAPTGYVFGLGYGPRRLRRRAQITRSCEI